MAVRCRQFSGGLFSWRRAVDEACAFAEEVGKDRLISISHGFGAIFVYYWE
jgi:hypothetical protein